MEKATIWVLAKYSFLTLVIVILLFPVNLVLAADSTMLTIDIWTSKGGQGPGASGGIYKVGEELILSVQSNVNCKGTFQLTSPQGSMSGPIDLTGNQKYSTSLGIMQVADIGQWRCIFEANVQAQYASDMVSWTVVAAGSTSVPIPTGTPAPPNPFSTSPVPTPTPTTVVPTTTSQSLPPAVAGAMPKGKIASNTASEFLALLAARASEGLLYGDPRFDVNGDGKVTEADVRQILKWAILVYRSNPPLTSTSPTASKPTTPAATSTPASILSDSSALLGKWKMNRVGLPTNLPEGIPEVAVNQIMPTESTWELIMDAGKLNIKYDGRKTWYKDMLLLISLFDIAEQSPVITIAPDGKSCTMTTSCVLTVDSLPLGLGAIFKVKEINGKFNSKMVFSYTGNVLNCTITLNNFSGTFQKLDEQTQLWKQEPISFPGTVVNYSGQKEK
jgi:hypothetical protein